MIPRHLHCLLLLIGLALLLPGTALPQRQAVTKGPAPGEGGDSVLPAGFKGVVWGASSEAIMAIRGGMEVQATPDHHIRKLIELPPPGT